MRGSRPVWNPRGKLEFIKFSYYNYRKYISTPPPPFLYFLAIISLSSKYVIIEDTYLKDLIHAQLSILNLNYFFYKFAGVRHIFLMLLDLNQNGAVGNFANRQNGYRKKKLKEDLIKNYISSTRKYLIKI